VVSPEDISRQFQELTDSILTRDVLLLTESGK
jgi:hypothetical protein